MNQYYLPLDLDKKEILSSTFKRQYVGVKWENIEYVKNILTHNFFTKLSSLAEITGAMIFNKIHHQTPDNAHIDIDTASNKLFFIPYGLNIVFDSSTDMKSSMRWYSHKGPHENIVQTSKDGTKFLSFPISSLNLEEEYCIDEKPVLVRTDVPHTIYSGNGFRTCISIRFMYYKNDWESGYHLFDQAFNH